MSSTAGKLNPTARRNRTDRRTFGGELAAFVMTEQRTNPSNPLLSKYIDALMAIQKLYVNPSLSGEEKQRRFDRIFVSLESAVAAHKAAQAASA